MKDWEHEQMKDWRFRFWCCVYAPWYWLVSLRYRFEIWRGKW